MPSPAELVRKAFDRLVEKAETALREGRDLTPAEKLALQVEHMRRLEERKETQRREELRKDNA